MADEWAKKVMKEHYPKLVRLLSREGLSAADAHDLASQGILELIVAMRRETVEKPGALLRNIVRKRKYDLYRKRHRSPSMVDYETGKTPKQLGTRLSTVVSRRATILNAMKEHLVQIEHEATLLRWGEGCTIDEVAQILEKSPATVKRWLASAKTKLEPELVGLLRRGEHVENAVEDAFEHGEGDDETS